ncbi:cytochrome P450 6A1-like [Stomoxys calcitrans]|uniref:cytochrome P450 6A1-like n=1 Tax=Stomoxys calcitrans TaxID=35570 RepID=UPI000DEDD3A4|nr:cytochrome P450 6A1-like [Stomoxys calcitrans]
MEPTTQVLYLVLACTSVVLVFLRRHLNYWKRRGIPHEEPHALFGNMKGARSEMGVGEILANYYHKFKGSGPFAGIYIGLRPAAVLLDKTAIKHVLIKDFSNFTDRGLYYNEKEDPLTGHIFFMDGQKWRRMRNKLSPTFTSGKMKYMYPTLQKVADELVEVLAERIQEDPVLEIRDLLGRFTTDIIGRVVFGIECNCLKNKNSDFMNFGRKSIEVPRHHSVIMNLIDSFPGVARKLGMRVLPEDVHQFFMRIIKETVDYREQNQVKANDFLNLLIELKNDKEDKSGLGGLTFEEMAAQLFAFFIAGLETSSSTMAYAIYELAMNPEIQDRLRHEVMQAFEKDEAITYETVMQIPYLNQVLSESLRKYPIGSFVTRRALNDYTIPGYPKYSVEKGTTFFVSILGIHHDPELYPNPEKFDPERFSPELVKQRESVEFLGFGDGPRNCIGMRFGQMQSRLGLAYIIKHYRFSVCPQTERNLKFDPLSQSLKTLHPILLRVEAI